jgi:hypothetical protein
MYITQHIRTSDGIILSAADVRCIPPQAQLFVPRSQVEAGATPENIAGYQAFIAEEVTLLGPAGTVVDCGDRGNKYLPQAVVTRQQQKTNDLRDQVDVAEKKLSDAKIRHANELRTLKDANATLQQQVSFGFSLIVVASVIILFLVVLLIVLWRIGLKTKRELERKVWERDSTISERNQRISEDEEELARLRDLLTRHHIEH